MTNEKLLNYQKRIEKILTTNILSDFNEDSLLITYGWVNACIEYNITITKKDSDNILEEIESNEKILINKLLKIVEKIKSTK